MSAHKLTLSVAPEVVEAAKRYTQAHGTSVSQLVEAFLAAVSSENLPAASSPVLVRLRGALRGADVEDHRRHLVEKYS